MSELRANGIDYVVDGRLIMSATSLAFTAGTLTVIVGPNGAGKTTLLRMLAGALEPSRGTVTLDGAPLGSIPAADRANALAFIAPARTSVPVGFTVEQVVAFGRHAHHSWWRSPPPGEAPVARAIERNGLAALRGRRIETLSDGERQRVWLASLDAQGSRTVLLDEPTAHLDARHVAETLRVLRTWASEGRTCIVVLHDLDAATASADRLVVIEDGRVALDGAVDAATPTALGAVFGIGLSSTLGRTRRRFVVDDYEASA